MKPFIICSDVYPFEIMVHFGVDKKELLYYLIKEIYKITDPCEVSETCASIMQIIRDSKNKIISFDDTHVVIITTDSVPNTPWRKGTLAHEIGHAAYSILKEFINTPHIDETEEVYSYYTQWITRVIYEKLEELGINLNSKDGEPEDESWMENRELFYAI